MAEWVFVSNYINHHQIPFCKEMYERLQGSFVFIQTEEMEADRLAMGWDQGKDLPFVRYMYREREECCRLIDEARVVIYGGVEDEQYLQNRLKAKRFIYRYTERLYREALWKAVSPRGLRRKYLDHTRYRKSPVYLLCAGAYVALDYSIVKAYPNKKFCWGYFTEAKTYEIDSLLDRKGYGQGDEKQLYILWAGRFLDCKNVDHAILTAEYLKQQGISFHMEVVGDGDNRQKAENLIQEKQLEDCVYLSGMKEPGEVRSRMEQADIFLFTSDRGEGWGAVVNESLNSGCAVVAGHMAGSVPFLIQDGVNGFVYRDGDLQELFKKTCRLAKDRKLRQTMGKNAYRTIVEQWNPSNAAETLLAMTDRLMEMGAKASMPWDGQTLPAPGSPAPVIGEKAMYRFLTKGQKRE